MPKIYGAEVVGLGKSLPSKCLTNQDLEKMIDTNDEWIQSRTGIKQRYIMGEGEALSDLCVNAAKQALEQAKLDVDDIDLIICGTFSADYRLPSLAALVQDKLGAKNTGAFDINAACTGFIYTLVTGAQFIRSGTSKNVLVIGADCCSSQIDWEDRSTCVLFGDGASALVLRRNEDPNVGVQSSYFGSDGGGKESLWIEAGGSLMPITKEVLQEKKHRVSMTGKDVFKFAINALTTSAKIVLKQEGLEASDIKLLVPHQANSRIINGAAKRLDFNKEQIYINIDRYGNTVAASVGLALRDSYDEGLMKSGDKILIIGFGAGLSWGGTVINWSID
ncbi:MAG: 3-oxoacyl-ACP synthase [Candidatus Cloacimonadota bacterium]|nr:MAG: 3-oxoacyl-ACP synthase [Candidatus Cloacimonadota bacterium]